MSTPDVRLSILEMEYALVAARLTTIDASLALLDKRVESIEATQTKAVTTLGRHTEQFDSIDRKLDELIRRLP